MSTTLGIVIGVGVFVLVAVIYSKFIVKDSSLEGLLELPGEELLFEETGIKVKQVGSPRSALFYGCKVRITNQRILVAQKMLFSKKFHLRLVATYTDPTGDGADLGDSLRSACVVATIPRDVIGVEGEGEERALAVPLGGGPLTGGQIMMIYSKQLPRITEALFTSRRSSHALPGDEEQP